MHAKGVFANGVAWSVQPARKSGVLGVAPNPALGVAPNPNLAAAPNLVLGVAPNPKSADGAALGEAP